MNQIAVLAKIFRRPGDTLLDFKRELDQLSAEEKLELATQGAKEFGYTLGDEPVEPKITVAPEVTVAAPVYEPVPPPQMAA